MSRPTAADIRRAILNVIQPMSRGKIESTSGQKARMSDVPPIEDSDRYINTLPFGFSSKAPAGVFGYFMNLLGSQLAPIILGHQHVQRPEPSAAGGSILYATTADGKTEAIRVEVTPDKRILLGTDSSDEPLVLGNIFTTQYDTHAHTGNLGAPTGPPLMPLSDHLSLKSFTEI